MNAAQPETLPARSKWTAPRPRVRELLKQAAELALKAPPEWMEEIDQAGLASDSKHFAIDDPVIMAASRRVIRSSLIHWVEANIKNPGAPVAPYIPNDMLASARELVRRGITDQMFNGSRVVQNTIWPHWMKIAFGLTSDPAELHELLDVSARSISAFIDGSMEGIAAFMKSEREKRIRSSHVDRRELVTLILEGGAVNTVQTSQRLGYNLDQSHHAAIVWSEETELDVGALEAAAQAFARCGEARQTLTVIANAATFWVWISGDKRIDIEQLRLAARPLAGVRMAIGSGGLGIEGFRQAHLDALATQRVLARMRSSARVVNFDMVRLVSLMAQHPEGTHQFVRHTLGDLAGASPVLRKTLLVFLSTGCNATKTAQLLHTHRNTLLRRLASAEQLLPRPLEHNRIHVAAALEALSWTAENQAQA